MAIVYVVMGVSGVGKTTIGELLASQLQVPFYDADDFHPKANRDRMASGHPLRDEDRWPWLDVLKDNITSWNNNTGAVLACSALKESYRAQLRMGGVVTFVYLEAPYELIKQRLASRKNHFFNPELLQSQFDALERPANCIKVDVRLTPDDIMDQLMNEILAQYDLGLIGLGVMGKSLARNFTCNNVTMALYNRHVPGEEEDVAVNFVNTHDELSSSKGYDDIAQFVNGLTLPRKIFLMVNAGSAVDAVIEALLPHLAAGDVIMDGGNSHYKETQRRYIALKDRDIHFLGVGVSGGERGALTGPSIMVGGSEEGYETIGNYLEKIAAKDRLGKACCTRLGNGGAGHFIKMIHNGIEYGEMQLIAEIYDVLKTHMKMSLDDIAVIFREWNMGHLESYLLDISATILEKKEKGKHVIDLILDKAKQKGTGGWSTTAALELGVSLDTISQSVMARIVSADRDNRVLAEEVYALKPKRIKKLSINTVKNAYSAARIINHSIGIEALRAASIAYNWDLQLAEITRVWTNGCIIRSRFMEDLVDILYDSDEHILLQKSVVNNLGLKTDDLLSFTSKVIEGRGAVPVFSAAANYFMAFTRKNSSASMIQAQRDFFGAHTYERIDKDGYFHTEWDH